MTGPPFDPAAEAARLRRRLERLAARPAWGKRKIFLRIGVPNLRQVVREDWVRLQDVDDPHLVALAESLWDGVTYDEMYLAVELLRLRPSLVSEALVDRLRDGLDNQAVTDDLATVVRDWVAEDPAERLTAVRGWIGEPGSWTRRLALLSTVALSRAGAEVPKVLELIESALDDRRTPVVNAVSAALRELTKSAPDRVEAFVEAHTEDLPARVRLEVWNKLRFGRKDGKPPRRTRTTRSAETTAARRRDRADRRRRRRSPSGGSDA